jgi:hypothetical protein
MKILVLTLVMSFLSHGAFGASSSEGLSSSEKRKLYSIDSIPEHIESSILQYLSPEDLCRARLTHYSFEQAANQLFSLKYKEFSRRGRTIGKGRLTTEDKIRNFHSNMSAKQAQKFLFSAITAKKEVSEIKAAEASEDPASDGLLEEEVLQCTQPLEQVVIHPPFLTNPSNEREEEEEEEERQRPSRCSLLSFFCICLNFRPSSIYPERA